MASNQSVPRDNNNVPLLNSYSTGSSGILVIPSAGTAVALSTVSVPCRAVAIYAFTTNSSTVAVGMDNGIIAEPASMGVAHIGKGEQLVQGASTDIYATDASNVYFNTGTSATTDGISYVIYV